MLGRPLEPRSLVWNSGRGKAEVPATLPTLPTNAHAQEAAAAGEPFVLSGFCCFFLPEAIKQRFLDSFLPEDLLPPPEGTLCLPASSPTAPGPCAEWRAVCPSDVPTGLGPWLGHSVWPLPSRQAGPHPNPSSPCQPQLLTGPLAPRRPSPCCPHPVGG